MSIRIISSIRDLAPARKICRRIAREVPLIRYGDCELRVLEIQLSYSPAGMVVKPHQHAFYEAIMILKGTGRETTPPGGKFKPGMLQLHPPRTIHGWKGLSLRLLRFAFWFDLAPPVPMQIPVRWPMYPSPTRAVETLLNEAQTEWSGRRERLTARITLMLTPFLKLLEWPESPAEIPDANNADRTITLKVDQFLADNLSQPITFEDVAMQMNMSIPTLARHIRRETGDSVMNRLHTLRMQRAAQILQEGTASVKETGLLVGIPEPSYFCRCFRRHFAQSPRRWQQQFRQNPNTKRLAETRRIHRRASGGRRSLF